MLRRVRMGLTPCSVHVGPVATSSRTRMISLTARRALAALVSALGWSGSMFAVGVDILHCTFKCKLAETANWKQATTEYKQQLWRGASHMSEQRRGLGDACMLAVPAEYARASSSSGDHPQQYYLHCPKLTTLEEKDFFPTFFIGPKNIFYRDLFI